MFQIENFHNFIVDITRATKDDAKLKQLLIKPPSKCIDEMKQSSYLTPAGFFASQGDIKNAERLRNLGANIDWIAHGAARGGHINYAEKLRTKNNADVSLIAEGAAFGGHIDYAEKLRVENNADVSLIAEGAAFGGHINYAEKLRLENGADVNLIAKGAAFGGHIDYAEKLRLENGAKTSLIACGAAFGGYRDYAEKLRINFHAETPWIASGAACGGHYDYAEYLRTQYQTNPTIIASSATQGGHRAYTEILRIKYGAYINEITEAAVKSFHVDYTEDLCIQDADMLFLITPPLFKPPLHPSQELRFFSFINHFSPMRRKLIKRLKQLEAERKVDRECYLSMPECFPFEGEMLSNDLLVGQGNHHLNMLAYYNAFALERNYQYRKIITHYRELKGFYDSRLKLLEKSGRINKMMRSGFQYDEASTWINNKDLRSWLHTSPSGLLACKTPINYDVYILIGSFLSSLSEQEIYALHKKIIFARNRYFLSFNIKSQSNFFGAFNIFSGVHNSANKLKEKAQRCDSPQKVLCLLEQEKHFFPKEKYPQYNAFITENLKRFTLFCNPQAVWPQDEEKDKAHNLLVVTSPKTSQEIIREELKTEGITTQETENLTEKKQDKSSVHFVLRIEQQNKEALLPSKSFFSDKAKPKEQEIDQNYFSLISKSHTIFPTWKIRWLADYENSGTLKVYEMNVWGTSKISRALCKDLALVDLNNSSDIVFRNPSTSCCRKFGLGSRNKDDAAQELKAHLSSFIDTFGKKYGSVVEGMNLAAFKKEFIEGNHSDEIELEESIHIPS